MISLLDLPGLRERDDLEPGFANELGAMALSLGLNPNYIGAVMSRESGFKPAIVNQSGGATGLIQFMPRTAIALGTTTAALRGMSAIDQLAYVKKFYAPQARHIRAEVPGDYYMATFMPALVGAPPETVIAKRGEPIYDQNAGLDRDHDGTLTVADVTRSVDETVAAARSKPEALFTSEKKKTPAALGLPSSPSGSPGLSSGPLSECVPVCVPDGSTEREP